MTCIPLSIPDAFPRGISLENNTEITQRALITKFPADTRRQVMRVKACGVLCVPQSKRRQHKVRLYITNVQRGYNLFVVYLDRCRCCR